MADRRVLYLHKHRAALGWYCDDPYAVVDSRRLHHRSEEEMKQQIRNFIYDITVIAVGILFYDVLHKFLQRFL